MRKPSCGRAAISAPAERVREGLKPVAAAMTLLVAAMAIAGLCGCVAGRGGPTPTPTPTPTATPSPAPSPTPDPGGWYRPPVDATWQWQLQPGSSGAINIDYAADVYDIDLFDAPQSVIDALHARGRRVLCYFSAGSFEDFRADAGDFASEDLGNTLEGFADERWLDIRSTDVRNVMLARLDLAAAKGCDGVEPDNVTGYLNDTGFDLTAADQLEYNRFLADEAHERGLAAALKNDLPQAAELVAWFDLSVNEQCHEFDECDALLPFIAAGKPVFNAEYAEEFVTSAAAREAMCTRTRALGFQTLVLPADLDDAFRFTCEP